MSYSQVRNLTEPWGDSNHDGLILQRNGPLNDSSNATIDRIKYWREREQNLLNFILSNGKGTTPLYTFKSRHGLIILELKFY